MSAVNWISRIGDAFERPASATGLAIFRILVMAVAIGEALQWLSFFDVFEATRSPHEQQFRYAMLVAHIVISAALLVGYRTRLFAVLNLATTATFHGTTHLWEYHVDYTLSVAALFLVVAPVSRVLSVDAWMAAKDKEPFMSATVPRGWYWTGAYILIGLVYFDSIFWKLADPSWLAGLGVWRPASLPFATYAPLGMLNALLNQYWLVSGLGWLTIVLELVFIFVLWFRIPRLVLLVVGLGLHIGIGIAFPIPLFGALLVGAYVLLVPAGFWDRAMAWLGLAESRPSLHSPARSDRYARKLPLVLVVFTAIQMLSIFFVSPLGLSMSKAVIPEKTLEYVRPRVRAILRKTRFVGSVAHPVFVNGHFIEHEHEFAVVEVRDGKRTFLPNIDENGQSSRYTTGRQWVNWSFRVVGNDVGTDAHTRRAVELYSRRWLKEQGRWPSAGARFDLVAREIDTSVVWAPDRLLKNAEQPWVVVGEASWSGDLFSYRLANVDETVAAAAR